MTPECWQRVKAALDEALRLDPEARAAYVAVIARDDPAVHPELQSLLGRRIGAYQIVDEIGTGGMGEVYRAVRIDDAYRQSVAIKLVRAGQGGSFVLARLKSERQILASLEHPNISRLLDGGTTPEGVPYLVMELIDGQPLPEYCDQHHLDVGARLRLFMQVCHAVHYAHQRLIIHRDIKPSNILVTAEGVPKLLDFGIAKILEPRNSSTADTTTASAIRLCTPAFASPEQLRGETITTATDIYSLGVVLYELLTGRRPHDPSLPRAHPIRRPSVAVRDGTAARAGFTPSATGALGKRLAGDLDNIVLMAMRAEPLRRYASAEQFASDIQHHLDHLPVIARRDTLAYRAGKFTRRHASAVTAGVLIALSLLTAVGVTLRQAQIARTERARSDRRFNDTHRLANSLMGDIYAVIKDLPGATPARQLLVAKALEYLDSLSADAVGDAALERDLATAYSRVGDVQGNPFYANLGDPRAALDSYRKALAIRRRLLAGDPGDARAVRELSGSYNQIGSAWTGLRNFAEALSSYRTALRLLEPVDAGSSDPRALDQLAGAHFYMATTYLRSGDVDHALQSIRAAAAIRDALFATDAHTATDILTHSAGDHSTAATILSAKSLYPAALEEQRRAVEIMNTLAQREQNNTTIQSFLARGWEGLGELQERTAAAPQALQSYRRSRAILEPLLAADRKNSFVALSLADVLNRLGGVDLRRGAAGVAVQEYRQAAAESEMPAEVNRYLTHCEALVAQMPSRRTL